MATFALVHGGWHGAWCWERLAPLLQHAGHDVVAMDLPCEDSSATFDTYANVVLASLDGRGDDVVIVGHSYGGLTIPLVAARRPVRHLVYLCALVPKVGMSLVDQLTDDPDIRTPMWQNVRPKALSEADSQSRQAWVDTDLARQMLFADCDDETAGAAIARLRPQANFPLTVPFSLTEFPTVASTYVTCLDDQMVGHAWSMRIARERLDAPVVQLPGSHSPFLSRPQALADVLIRIADE